MGIEWKYSDGQTPISEEEKEGLINQMVTLQSELDELEQYNIEKALQWTIRLKVSKEVLLSEYFIKNLHQKMYGEVWKWAGKFRKSDKNIGVKWAQISIELRNLLDDTLFWINNESFEPEEIAIRFKHRLVSIHCFPNGNGRHSRFMADLLMEKVYKKAPFSWYFTNLTDAGNVRKKYISALKEADKENLQPLIEFACSNGEQP
jgi:Fic-DOC domain mobile mystery protein B